MSKSNIRRLWCLIPVLVIGSLFLSGCEGDGSESDEPALEMPAPLGNDSRAFHDMQVQRAKESAATQSVPAEDEVKVYEDMFNSRTN
jgi:hypothetical protein